MSDLRGLIVTGPTGCGKSRIGVELAERLGRPGLPRHILCADSVTVYRELSAGTARPSAEMLARVPHHLLDVCSVADGSAESPAYTARRFVDDVRALLDRIPAPPLVVGGSCFYIDALLRGPGPQVPPQAVFRRKWLNQERAEPGSIYRALQQADSAAARVVSPAQTRRALRALEIKSVSGRSVLEFELSAAAPFQPLLVVLTVRDRSRLYEWIDRRTEEMYRRGLVEEAADLVSRFGPDRPALKSIGYAEAAACARGELTLAQAQAITARRTRNFAKRQMTWWRRPVYGRVHRVDVDDSPVERIVLLWERSASSCAEF